ncbi:3-isopropylmalate dehydratase small subunit [Desulfosediminicola flagellatus]|uniref:3-isopropylmalate dehydratase small subunit n=1 Tax=Desulfosediminicola flagellatus TaxID=2569541 RepID=UPI0010ACDA8D|nr:3-isopropylmalate dehydratase small subunit [Desulfosediminicola flagellatus]
MQPFTKICGVVLPLDRANVDTDAIIPKQYLKSINRTGFGPNLFDDWRYLDPGEPFMDHTTRRINSDFILNKKRYQGAEILLARENYGCGSSREHAVWAMVDYGFRVVIAPSFADIFYGNTLNNGLLAITLDAEVIDQLFEEVKEESGYTLTVDLEAQTITTPSDKTIEFSIAEYRRHRLLNGLDDIGMTLLHSDKIKKYEQNRKQTAPWLF